MLRATIDASHATRLPAYAARQSSALHTKLERDVARTQIDAEGFIKTGTPVFMGEAVGSVHSSEPQVRTSSGSLEVTGSVVATASHWPVIELGRRPGRTAPPLRVIERWVELKIRRGQFDLDADLRIASRRRKASVIRSVAFVIARAIGRRGMPGRKIFEGAETKYKPVLEARIRRTVDAWAQRF
jgi:hypothetical protein